MIDRQGRELGFRPLAVLTNVSDKKLTMRIQGKLGVLAALVLVAAMFAARLKRR
jgi:hypothetical protein